LEGADDAGAGVAIAIGVDGLAHTTIGGWIVQEGADLGDNEVVVGKI
jgi:hypothetical protein